LLLSGERAIGPAKVPTAVGGTTFTISVAGA